MMDKIALSEWLDAINAAQVNDPGHTLTELSDQLGLPVSTMRGRIKKALQEKRIKTGEAVRGHRVYKVYQLIEKKGK